MQDIKIVTPGRWHPTYGKFTLNDDAVIWKLLDFRRIHEKTAALETTTIFLKQLFSRFLIRKLHLRSCLVKRCTIFRKEKKCLSIKCHILIEVKLKPIKIAYSFSVMLLVKKSHTTWQRSQRSHDSLQNMKSISSGCSYGSPCWISIRRHTSYAHVILWSCIHITSPLSRNGVICKATSV